MPGQRQRQRDGAERGPGRGAEIGGGLLERRVAPGQAGVQRQDHERQVGVGDADIHRRVGVEQLHRRQPNRPSAALIQPSSRSSPIQAVMRSRNPVQNGSITSSSSGAPALRRAGDRQRHRIADQQAQRRRHAGDEQALQRGIEVEGILGERRVVGRVGVVQQRREGRHAGDAVLNDSAATITTGAATNSSSQAQTGASTARSASSRVHSGSSTQASGAQATRRPALPGAGSPAPCPAPSGLQHLQHAPVRPSRTA